MSRKTVKVTKGRCHWTTKPHQSEKKKKYFVYYFSMCEEHEEDINVLLLEI